jgi:hypothetical protein
MKTKKKMPGQLESFNKRRTLANMDRNAKIIDLKIAGASERAIAKEVGLSCAQVDRIIQDYYKAADKIKSRRGSRMVDMELDRLDKLTLALFANRNDPRTADTLLHIMERRAKYLGLDKPIKIDANNTNTGEMKQSINFTKLPDDKLDQLLALIDEATKSSE